MVRIPCFYCHGLGSIPGGETEIPQATWCSQKKKKSRLLFNSSIRIWMGNTKHKGEKKNPTQLHQG